jgi:hypothetical protein
MKFNDVMTELYKNGVSLTTVNRIERLSCEFATKEAFFLASRGDLEKAFARMCPDAKRGLGSAFLGAMSMAVRYWKEPDGAPAAKPEPATTERDPRLDETLTAQEVLLVAELMERFKKAEVSVDWILQQVKLARA